MEKQKPKKEKVKIKENFKEYLNFLFRYRWICILSLIIIIITESIQIFVNYLFKIIVDKGTLFYSKELPLDSFIYFLKIIALIFIFIYILSSFLYWIGIHFLNRIETQVITDIKREYFNHLVSLDYNFHITHKTGSLISRLSRVNGAIERLTDTLYFNLISLFVQLILVIASLIYFDWISSIIVFFTFVVFISYSLFIQKLQAESNLIANDKEDLEKGNISDSFTNIESIKYFGKENLVKENYKKISEETRIAFLKTWDYYKYLSSGQTLIIGIGTFLLIYFPILKLINGEITIGTLTFIYTTFIGLVGGMFGFVFGIRNFYRALADLQDLFDYKKIEKGILDKPNAKKLKIKKGEIEFRNVYFSYGKRKIFENFNLKIPAGKKIALIGPSGSGKTTLIKLLYRLYDIDSGSIKIDNIDIRDVTQESLRSEMSIVPQECVLFNDTIYNNIAFAKPEATKEEIMNAIKFAQLDKVIESLPNKENTIIGERGIKLSGGEKQRVSIARALLANKKILILDEATSSLDTQTEKEIQKDLQELMKGKTAIIIAHRLSTIMNADEIIVMDKGKIIQRGTHEELIKQEGMYKKLWSLQKDGYIK